MRAADSVVAYLDILGYVEKVKAVAKERRGDPFLRSLRDAFDAALAALKRIETAKSIKVDIKAFSDNIVISLPVADDAEEEFLAIIEIVAAFQCELVMHGLFVRGAIAIGPHYVDTEIVFGEALLEAYLEEHNEALNPRVTLALSATSRLSHHIERHDELEDRAPQKAFLMKDFDGKYFVNYLAALTAPPGEVAPTLEQMQAHGTCVSRELKHSLEQQRVWTKYQWVARLHDKWCDKWGLDCKIAPELTSIGPVEF